jgi:hypothetical protein
MIKKEDVVFKVKPLPDETIGVYANLSWTFLQEFDPRYGDQEKCIEIIKKTALHALRKQLYGEVISTVREIYNEIRMLPTSPIVFDGQYDKLKNLLETLLHSGKEITD